jgi:hypothetical protein
MIYYVATYKIELYVVSVFVFSQDHEMPLPYLIIGELYLLGIIT